MINLNILRQEKHQILNGRFRVRLFKKESVPGICDIPEVDENVLLVDLPKAEGYEAKMLEIKHARLQSLLAEVSSNTQDDEKENLPAGCEKASEQLNVTFLSIEKLDKLAAENKTRMEENGFEIATSLDRFAQFDLHLVPQLEAHNLINDLCHDKILDQQLEFTLIIFIEGSEYENNLFLGIKNTPFTRTSFKGRYLGDYNSSKDELDRLCFKRMPLREAKCQCRFDVLQYNKVFIEKTGNFIPANFTIEAEWELKGQTAVKEQAKQLLKMPPNNASVLIKFKPGWMDARVPLTDRIIELRYLTELANGLKSGISPLACGKNAPKEQPELIDRLKQLIAGAKNKLDSQPIFPFDFTDRLWDVLKTVKSMEILRQCIQLVYDQMQTGEFHVLVEANKVSSLAKMLRVRNPADNIFPRLEPLVCLQMLIEIGLDRFNGELAYHFFSRHFLPNSFDLEPYFLAQAKPLESKIERLFPLHLALQSAIIMEEYVKFPEHEKTNVTKHLLSHFTALQGIEAFEKEFIYKAQMEDIRREKVEETITDWCLERRYSHYDSTGELKSGIIDGIHLSKNIGIKYLRPPNTQENDDGIMNTIIKRETSEDADGNDSTGSTIVKQEISGYGDGNNSSIIKMEAPQFECIYVTITSHPSGLFV